MADTKRDLLDEDGENRALRTFLMQYGLPGLTVGAMRDHMKRSGWGAEYWPFFVSASNCDAHLTKAGAQIWIRHLLGLERATPRSPSTAPEGCVLVPESATNEMICAIEAAIDSQLVASAMSPAQMFRQDGERIWESVVEIAKVAALASRPAEVDDMAMLIRQLAHSLKKSNPNSELPERAVDYLRRKNLLGSALRSAPSHTTNKEK